MRRVENGELDNPPEDDRPKMRRLDVQPQEQPKSAELPKITGSKRPRRAATLGKSYVEDAEDPYVYTSGIVLRGNQRRRKLEEDDSKLESISASLSA